MTNSQSLNTAEQDCKEVCHSFISLTGDQTHRRESRNLRQVPVQLLPLTLRQQIAFIQHQETPVCEKSCDKMRFTLL